MKGRQLIALADGVEADADDDRTSNEELIDGLKAAFGDAATGLTAEAGLLGSTEAALHAVDAMVPGWEISIKGIAREPDWHWTCTMRETSVTDDDAVIGFGRSPALPNAIIAALLRIAAMRLPN